MVFDRENLSGIAEANKMIAEGFIDVNKAKELGKLLSVDAIIIGNYTVLSNTIKLTIKALDSSNGCCHRKDLPIDGDAGALLGINVPSSGGGVDNNANRGFNRPLNSNEQYNNPETVNKECETKNQVIIALQIIRVLKSVLELEWVKFHDYVMTLSQINLSVLFSSKELQL
ncbi:MAG: hypothetical protein IPH04_11225 [Saprospirales bacterium]|nr:hypothetical protein [Saprospirales bacterium]